MVGADGKVRGFERPWDLAATPEQLALARGMVWRRVLELGEAQSMREIARLEGVDGSYVARLVGVTLLSPFRRSGGYSKYGYQGNPIKLSLVFNIQ